MIVDDGMKHVMTHKWAAIGGLGVGLINLAIFASVLGSLGVALLVYAVWAAVSEVREAP